MRLTFAALAVTLLTSGCGWFRHTPEEMEPDSVLLIYVCGFNNLSNNLKSNIQALEEGFIPEKKSDRILLLAEHLTKTGSNYTIATEPHLIRFYKEKGIIVRDTLKTYPSTFHLAKTDDMGTILADVRTLFNAKHYGMVFSSHATGWLPRGYYSKSENEDIWLTAPGPKKSAARRNSAAGAVPFYEPEQLPGPAVRSLGASNTSELTYEMELPEFSRTIQKEIKLDYLVIDACLSGGVEVAYELKDACGKVVFSPAEELAEGMDYSTMAGYLLQKSSPDLNGLAEKYYNTYLNKSDSEEQSATVTVVDCSALGRLAQVCTALFSKYRDGIANVDSDSVQRFFRASKHWFYDLEDILVKAGITSAEKAELEEALGACIGYKAHTEHFLPHFNGFKIDTYCGLSMYLPKMGTEYLDGYYKTLKWNIATGLVE